MKNIARHSSLVTVVMLAALTLLSSCFNDDDETETDYTCMVSSATFGTLKRSLHTLDSEGNDSVYTVSVTGSNYPLTIDHLAGLIYNVDSLPVNTNVDKVVFSAFNCYGTAAIESLYSKSDSIFTYSDSTDCRQPRAITIYGTDGTSRRHYTLDVRMHREEADSIVWHLRQTAPAAPAADSRLSEWQQEIAQQVKATATAEDASASDKAQLDSIPVTELSGFSRTMAVDAALDEQLLVGQTESGDNVVWKRYVDKTGTELFQWQQIEVTDEVRSYRIPQHATSLNLMPYKSYTMSELHDCSLLVCVDPSTSAGSEQTGSAQSGTVKCLLSADNGRTWRTDRFVWPEMQTAEPVSTVKAWVDDDQNIWICSYNAAGSLIEAWQGRLNVLGWNEKDTQKVFTETRRK